VNEAASLNMRWFQWDAFNHDMQGVCYMAGVREVGGAHGRGEVSAAREKGCVQEKNTTLRGLDGTVHDDQGDWTPELALDQLKEWFHTKLSCENEWRNKGKCFCAFCCVCERARVCVCCCCWCGSGARACMCVCMCVCVCVCVCVYLCVCVSLCVCVCGLLCLCVCV